MRMIWSPLLTTSPSARTLKRGCTLKKHERSECSCGERKNLEKKKKKGRRGRRKKKKIIVNKQKKITHRELDKHALVLEGGCLARADAQELVGQAVAQLDLVTVAQRTALLPLLLAVVVLPGMRRTKKVSGKLLFLFFFFFFFF